MSHFKAGRNDIEFGLEELYQIGFERGEVLPSFQFLLKPIEIKRDDVINVYPILNSLEFDEKSGILKMTANPMMNKW